MRAQSDRKTPSRTSAVARCVATRNERKKSSSWWMSQPRSLGRSTPWPSDEIGNGSAIPWSRPRTIPWR
jgi:hypothetical protein